MGGTCRGAQLSRQLPASRQLPGRGPARGGKQRPFVVPCADLRVLGVCVRTPSDVCRGATTRADGSSLPFPSGSRWLQSTWGAALRSLNGTSTRSSSAHRSAQGSDAFRWYEYQQPSLKAGVYSLCFVGRPFLHHTCRHTSMACIRSGPLARGLPEWGLHSSVFK